MRSLSIKSNKTRIDIFCNSADKLEIVALYERGMFIIGFNFLILLFNAEMQICLKRKRVIDTYITFLC
jgi:hypothetical protein